MCARICFTCILIIQKLVCQCHVQDLCLLFNAFKTCKKLSKNKKISIGEAAA